MYTTPETLIISIHCLSLTQSPTRQFYPLLLTTSIFHSICPGSKRVKCALGGPLLTMPRKRSLAEMETSEPAQKQEEPSLLQRIRNMWEFASVMQYIFTFGKAVKIDEDFDVEVCYTSTACYYTISMGFCGVALINGIANLMDPGFRGRMPEAWLLRETRGDWPHSAQVDLLSSRP